MQTNTFKSYLYPTLLLVLVGITPACTKKENQSQEAEEAKVVPVTVGQAREMSYVPTIRFSGSADPARSASLGTALPGRVERVHYTRGSYVPKGALIVEMSDELLVQAKIENDAIKRDFDRIARLREKESVSQMDYDHVKAKYDASVSKVEMLKKNTSITAPFSGIIKDILVNEGETYSFTPSVSDDLKLESGVVELVQVNPLKITIEVNEKELRHIAVGQSATITFDALPGDTIAGKVSYLSPVLSSMTRTAAVEVNIPNNGNRLKPGMYCNVAIALPEREGVFVPLGAIYRLAGTSEEQVFKVNDDRRTVSGVPVIRGELRDGWVYVEGEGIKSGDTVVLEGKNKLSNGSQINIVER